MISRGQETAGTVLLSIVVCWMTVTFFTVDSMAMTWMAYEQVIAVIVGAVLGITISAFAITPLTIDKVRRETFSFVGILLALSLFMVLYNLSVANLVCKI